MSSYLNRVIDRALQGGGVSSPALSSEMAYQNRVRAAEGIEGVQPSASLYDQGFQGLGGIVEFSRQVQGGNQAKLDRQAERTIPEVIGDTALGIADGVIQGITSPLALGVRPFSQDAAQSIVGFGSQYSDWNRGIRSDTLQNRQKYNDIIRQSLAKANDDKLANDLDSGDSELTASLKHIGRGIVDSFTTASADGAVFGSQLATVAGSIAPTIAATGGVSSLVGATSTAARARVGAGVVTGSEIAGVYSDTTSRVLDMSTEELYKNSPQFKRRMDNLTHGQNLNPLEYEELAQQVKREIAGNAADEAALYSAPFALASGVLSGGFVANPFSGGFRNATRDIIGEALGESVIGGGGQFAGNIGIQRHADESINLVEDVGVGIGEGAIYGTALGTAMKTPQAIAGTVETAYKAAKKAGEMLGTAASTLSSDVDTSPESLVESSREIREQMTPERVQAVTEEIQTLAEESPQDANEFAEYFNTLVNSTFFSATEQGEADKSVEYSKARQYDAGEKTIEAIEQAEDRIDLLARLAENIIEGSNEQDVAASSRMFYSQMMDIVRIIQSDDGAMEKMDPSSQAANVVYNVNNLMAVVDSSPALREALSKAQEYFTVADVTPVDPATVDTPKGQTNLETIVAKAEVAPETLPPEIVDQVLRQDSQGIIELTPSQRAALAPASGMIRAATQYDRDRQEVDSVDSSVAVGEEIKTLRGEGTKGRSGTGYAQQIVTAMQAGNVDDARTLTQELGMFAEHMANKVGALNKSLKDGGRHKYQALNSRTRDWFESTAYLGVTPSVPRSTAFARNVEAESRFVTTMYNSMVEAFPELNLQPMDIPTLDWQGKAPRAFTVQATEATARTPEEVVQQDTPQPVEQVDTGFKLEATEPTSTTPSPEPDLSFNLEATEPESRTPTEDTLSTEEDRTIPSEVLAEVEQDIASREERTVAEDIALEEARTRLEEEPEETSAAVTTPTESTPVVQETPASRQETTLRATPEATVGLEEDRVIPADVLSEVEQELSSREDRTTSDDIALEEIRARLDQEPEDITSVMDPTPTTVTPEDTPTSQVDGSVTEEESTYRKELSKRFEGLSVGDDNGFKRAYRLPAKVRSRIINTDSPIAAIKRLVRNPVLEDGSVIRTIPADVRRAYSNLLNAAEGIIDTVQNQLDSFVRSKNVKGKVEEASKWLNGQALNITEQGEDGSITYNPQLIQTATVAALDWVLEGDSRVADITFQDAADMLDKPITEVTPSFVQFLNEGLTVDTAANSLAQKIKSYWGVSENTKTGLGLVDGIALAVGKELIRALESQGAITKATYKVGGDRPQTFMNIRFNTKIEPNTPLAKAPDLLKELANTEPERTRYIGEGNVPPVPEYRHRNRLVPLTEDQKEAVKTQQEMEFFPVRQNAVLFATLGLDNLISLFGETIGDPKKYNARHLESIRGKNTNISTAFSEMVLQLNALDAYAQEHGLDVENIPTQYAYAVTTEGRMHMQGRANPQSNKLMREVMMSTRSTLDMTQEINRNRHGLAMAQALGVKVNNIPHEVALEQVRDRLELMPDTIRMLEEFQGSGFQSLSNEFVNTFKREAAEARVPVSFVALHALNDYARLLTTDNLTEFQTHLYLEADGVTNGPFNAMIMLGAVDMLNHKSWSNNVAMGGLFLHHTPGMTMNQFRSQAEEVNSTDLYLAVGDAANRMLGSKKETLRLGRVLSTLIGDLSYDNGQVSFTRDGTKNPVTITIYGSGMEGIAGNIVEAFEGELYAAYSRVIADNSTPLASPNEFLNDYSISKEDAKEKVQNFFNELSQILGTDVNRLNNNNPSFIIPNRQRLTKGVLYNLVEPLVDSIRSVVSGGVMDTASSIQKLTSIQSKVMRIVYEKEVGNLLDEKVKADPNFKRSEALSSEELNKLLSKISKQFPWSNVGSNRMSFLNYERTTTGLFPNYGKALDETLTTQPTIPSIRDAGVAGIPYYVIGSGDGQTTINDLLDSADPSRVLWVFDGKNLPLDMIEQGGYDANAAVAKTITSNSALGILRAMARSRDNLEAAVHGLTEKELEEFRRDIAHLVEPDQAVLPSMIVDSFDEFFNDFTKQVTLIEANHQTLKKTAYSIDQMASTQNPYVNDGLVFGTEEHTKLYETEKIKAHNKIQKVLNHSYEVSDTEYNTLYSSDVESFSELMGDLSPEHTETINKLGLNNIAEGLTFQRIYDPSFSGSGAYDPNTGTIYLNKARKWDSETVLHEVLHAGTVDTLVQYFNNSLPKGTNPAVSLAIQDLQNQMHEFLATEPELENLAGVLNAKDAISRELSKGITAYAISEYISWGLTNSSTASTLKTTEARKSYLNNLFNKIKKALKSLLGARFNLPESSDLYSNLVFNTTVIATGGTGIGVINSTAVETPSNASDLFLMQNRVYGSDDRLTAINENMAKAIKGLRETVAGVKIKPDGKIKLAVTKATAAVLAAQSAGFKLTPQEATTFELITTAMALENVVDSSKIIPVQKIYRDFVKDLSVEDFMVNPESDNDPNDRVQALRKYELLVGRSDIIRDENLRSSLLPMFIGLATTSPELRGILSSRTVSDKVHPDGTLDGYLESVGSNAMNRMMWALSGQTSIPNSASAAIDAMLGKVDDVNNSRLQFVSNLSETTQNALDKANEMTVKGIDYLAEKTTKVGLSLRDSNNKMISSVGSVLSAAGGLASNRTASAFADDINATVHSASKLPRAIKEIVSDFVGRTDENANVYDMIKRVKVAIQRERQQYREDIPQHIAQQFNTVPNAQQWSHLTNSVLKTDVGSLLSNNNLKGVIELISTESAIRDKIVELEGVLSKHYDTNWKKVHDRAVQLANYMNTGEAGAALRVNAKLIDLEVTKGSDENLISSLDQLISLYALESLDSDSKDTLQSMVRDNPRGVEYLVSYASKTNIEEISKGNINYIKGYIPDVAIQGKSLTVAPMEEHARLTALGYKRVGDVSNSILRRGTTLGYYFAPFDVYAKLNPGIMQTAKPTVTGVDQRNGTTPNSIIISDPRLIKHISRLHGSIRSLEGESLVPVFSTSNPEIVSHYRLEFSPEFSNLVDKETNAAKLLGIWRGRQVEEAAGDSVNEALVDNLIDMANRERSKPDFNKRYMNILDDKISDPIYKDVLRLMPANMREYIKERVGDNKPFYVRKDMLNDVFGYRSASVGDIWTGSSRWSPRTQKQIRELANMFPGKRAMEYAIRGEQLIQNVVGEVRTLIIVKSVVVPAINFLANMYHLVARGVPLDQIAKGVPKALNEIKFYTDGLSRIKAAEADMFAETNPLKKQHLKSEVESIKDSFKRLDIYPLLEAGEFSSISDSVTTGDLDSLTSGKLDEYIGSVLDRMPDGLKTAGRYLTVAKDTALFKAMQRATDYGDFIAKAIIYTDLTTRKNRSTEQALAQITDEFVNYDKLPGRGRQYLENMGLLWFYNWKIRASKIAVSMMRNNPFHAFIAMNLPSPDMFGNIGIPVEDAAISRLFDGSLGYSMGPEMGINSPSLNPWYNLTH